MIREMLGEAVQKGLPILGAILGGSIGIKRNASLKKTAAYSGGGWALGYLTQRALLWGYDRMVPGLPDVDATINEQGQVSVPEVPDTASKESSSVGATPEVSTTGGEGSKNVTPLRTNTKSPFELKRPMGQ